MKSQISDSSQLRIHAECDLARLTSGIPMLKEIELHNKKPALIRTNVNKIFNNIQSGILSSPPLRGSKYHFLKRLPSLESE